MSDVGRYEQHALANLQGRVSGTTTYIAGRGEYQFKKYRRRMDALREIRRGTAYFSAFPQRRYESAHF